MNRRALLAFIGTITVTGTAGCSGLTNRSPDGTARTTPTNRKPTPTTTAGTTARTTSPTVAFTPEASVLVRNRTDTEQTAEVTVTDPESEEVAFDETVTLGPEEERTFSEAFVEPDTMIMYLARVRLGDQEVTQRFQVGKGSGLWRLVVTVEEDEVAVWGTYAN